MTTARQTDLLKQITSLEYQLRPYWGAKTMAAKRAKVTPKTLSKFLSLSHPLRDTVLVNRMITACIEVIKIKRGQEDSMIIRSSQLPPPPKIKRKRGRGTGKNKMLDYDWELG